ncbi:MAG: hypothetical protein Fur0037_21550 [Planctomycetota bacterium]
MTEGKLWPVTMADSMRALGMPEDLVERMTGFAKGMQHVVETFAGDERRAGGQSGGRRDPARDFDMESFFSGMVPLSVAGVTPPERPKQLTYQVAQSVAGMSVMMLMFGLMACSTTLLVEREKGTLRRMLVSRMRRDSIVLGKYLFCLVIGLLQMGILFAYGDLLFDVGRFRDPATLFVLTLTWAACATSFGMLIATWARTPKQAEGLSTLLILFMAGLGGCWFPIQIAALPWYADVATHATLTFWAMSAFQGMFWNQHSWTRPGMLLAIGLQWAFALAAGAASLRLFASRYSRG